MTGSTSAFGARLRELRMAAGLSQPRFGRIVAYHPSLISKLETGAEQPSRAFAQRADDALDAVACSRWPRRRGSRPTMTSG